MKNEQWNRIQHLNALDETNVKKATDLHSPEFSKNRYINHSHSTRNFFVPLPCERSEEAKAWIRR